MGLQRIHEIKSKLLFLLDYDSLIQCYSYNLLYLVNKGGSPG